MKLQTLLLLFISLSAVHPARGAGGAITGTVTGGDDSAPLIGVNVVVQGSVRGASTNHDGWYRIADVAPGTYTLVFSLVGYQREIRAGIVVEEDRTTVVNVALTVQPVVTDQVVTTANKREQSLQDVPVSIAVVDATDMSFRNAQTIEDAMRYVAGVNITGGQVNIRGSSGYTKGTGSRIIMLLDGIPFLAGDTGDLLFETIPVGQIDRIEVVKGASSALYGSSALGGVINIITKPISAVPETHVRTYAGFYGKPSHDRWDWTNRGLGFGGLSAGHAQKFDDLGVSLFFSRQFNDGYRQNDHVRRYNIYAKGRYDISPENSLTLNFGLLSQNRGQHNWWRNIDSALHAPYVQRDDAVRSIRYFVSGLYNDAISDKVLFTGKAILNHNDWLSTTWHDNPPPRWKDYQGSISNDYRIEGGVTYLHDARHTMTSGVTGQFFTVDSPGSLFGKHSGWSAAFYAQDEWAMDEQFALTFGVRLDLQRIGIADAGPQLNPKLALTFKPAEQTTLRASYGRGFRVPSVAEVFVALDLGSGINTLPNKDLKPERSSSHEIGVVQQLANLGSIDFALFWSEYDNLIEPTPFQDPVTNEYKIQWQNTPQARVQGFEASWRLAFFEGDLLWNFGYTYAYAEDLTPRTFSGLDSLVNLRPNNVLPYRPKHVLTTGVLGRWDILRLGVDFRYLSRVDRVFDLFVNTRDLIIPNADARVAILVTDVRLGAELTSFGIPLAATLSVNNIFQYNYLELTANMAPPRTLMLVLESRL